MFHFRRDGHPEANAMYGLPETFDPSFFQEKEIESVCFFPYQVNVYLAGGIRVQVEGRYKLFQSSKMLEAVSAFPISQSALLQLIGKKVIGVSFTARSGDIEFSLESELKLFIEGDTGPYESYRLFDGQKEIIV